MLVVAILSCNYYFLQLMAEMQRLVNDAELRVSSIQSWKTITPKVLSQARIEAVHNSRLRISIAQTSLDDEGVHTKKGKNWHISCCLEYLLCVYAVLNTYRKCFACAIPLAIHAARCPHQTRSR